MKKNGQTYLHKYTYIHKLHKYTTLKHLQILKNLKKFADEFADLSRQELNRINYVFHLKQLVF